MAFAKPHPVDPAGYEEDFFLWSQAQAERIRALRPNSLDWENIAEAIESSGTRDRRKIESYLARVVQHLLKWAYQPERRGTSWRMSIYNGRISADRIMQDSLSLRSHPGTAFAIIYDRGKNEADIELDADPSRFPDEPPFTIEQVLDPDWLPNDMRASK